MVFNGELVGFDRVAVAVEAAVSEVVGLLGDVAVDGVYGGVAGFEGEGGRGGGGQGEVEGEAAETTGDEFCVLSQAHSN